MTTWIIVPYFCKGALMVKYLDYLNDMNRGSMHVVVVNDHYPINPSEQQLVKIVATEIFDFAWVDCKKNRGMQGAINYALTHINAQNDDIVILSDPDDYPSYGAYQALANVIRFEKSIAVAALSFKEIEENRKWLIPYPNTARVSSIYDWRGGVEHCQQAHWIHPYVDLWHIAAYRMEWINSIGGFGQAYPFWGGLESYLYERWSKQGMKLVYLTDYHCEAVELDRSDPELFDKEYQEYKCKGVQLEKFTGSFADWISRKK